MLAFIIIVWLLCAILGAILAREKGRGDAGFWLGLIFGPVGIVIALLLPPCDATRNSNASDVAAADLKALIGNKGKTGISVSTADGCTVVGVADGSPAHLAGVQAGDRLLMIDGEFCAQDYRATVLRLVGAPGTDVSMSVRRGETARDFTLVRE